MTHQPPSSSATPSQCPSPSQQQPQYIIDSHIHLWPASASNSTSHSWMTPPSMPLAREHLLRDYITSASRSISLPATISAVSPPLSYKNKNKNKNSSSAHQASLSPTNEPKPHLLGAIYIETDRALPTLTPNHVPESRYTHPLAEIAFLRSLINSSTHSLALLALIPWAPVDEGAVGMERYMALARQVAGAETWAKVAGFRFLVQGMRERGVFEEKVRSQAWMEGLRWLGREGRGWRVQRQGGGGMREKERGFVFEVGVDQRQGGTWQLDEFAKCVGRVRAMEDEDGVIGGEEEGRTVFVLNHFCKPAFSNNAPTNTETNSFTAWKRALTHLSALPPIYLKLSGFLTELSTSPLSSEETFACILPYVRTAFECFGARRIMFGSDWPVCGVGVREEDEEDEMSGDEGDNGGGVRKETNPNAWCEWYQIVTLLLDELRIEEQDREWVWWRTSVEVYGLDL